MNETFNSNFISKKIFLVVAILFSFLSLLEALKYLEQKDAVDLGYRITGARLLVANKSPYLYVWKEGDDKKFYNQYEVYNTEVNGVTVPPSVLILMSPFASFDANSVKWSWAVFSYALLGVTIFLFFKLSEEEHKYSIITVALFFFSGSIGWLLHIQRGQNYIVYLSLLTVVYYLFKREKIYLSLGVLALLIWLRFPFAIFLIPFIPLFKKPKYIFVFISYGIVLIGGTFLFTNLQDWKDYFYALTEWSKAQVVQSEFFSDAQSLSSKHAEIGAIKNESEYLINNSSFQYLFQYHLKIGLFKLDLFALFMLGLVVLVYPIRKIVRRGSAELLFLLAFLIYILFELCIPAPRYNYNYIQWMFPLLLILASYKHIRVKPYQWLFCAIGLSMNMGLFIYIPRSITIGEFLLFGTVWLILIGNKKSNKEIVA